MRERVLLCKLLAKELPRWRSYFVDVYGNVHFKATNELPKHKHPPTPSEAGGNSAEQAGGRARRALRGRAALRRHPGPARCPGLELHRGHRRGGALLLDLAQALVPGRALACVRVGPQPRFYPAARRKWCCHNGMS